MKRVTPQQLESWGVVASKRGRLVGSNAYALLTGGAAFSIERGRETVNAGSRDSEGTKETLKAQGRALKRTNGRFAGVVDEILPLVYEKIKLLPGIRGPTLMLAVNVSCATVARVLAKLQSEGKIEFRGASKNGGYYCK